MNKLHNLWAAKWRSENKLDGKREYFIYAGAFTPALFRTRHDCREFIKGKYGYIVQRPDLRAEPHGWKMPVAVKVSVNITEIKNSE